MFAHVELTKAFLIYCPAHQEQYYRPYESTLTGETLNHLINTTENGMLMTPTILADVAGSIIRPSSTPNAAVNIANGFMTPRFAFFLEFTTKNPGLYNGETKEIVSGFTSHISVDQAGNIDPQTIFYINSRQTLRSGNLGVGTAGFQPHAMLDQNQNILPKVDATGIVSMRPEDVTANHFIQTQLGTSAVIMDKRYDLSKHYLTSPRDSCIPAHYLNRIIKGYQNSFQNNQSFNEPQGLFAEAIANVRSESLYHSNFLVAMGHTNPIDQGMFTFSEINGRWPRIPDFWKKTLPTPNSKVSSPRDNSESWYSAVIETDIAFNLTHALPSVMSRLMIIELKLEINNMNMTGEAEVGIVGMQGMFDNMVTPQRIQYLIGIIKTDIIRGIILNKVGSFNISMHVHLLKQGTFMISVNGGVPTPYIAPMFCESYYSPVIGSLPHLSSLTSGIDSIITRFGEVGMFADPSIIQSNAAYEAASEQHYYTDHNE